MKCLCLGMNALFLCLFIGCKTVNDVATQENIPLSPIEDQVENVQTQKPVIAVGKRYRGVHYPQWDLIFLNDGEVRAIDTQQRAIYSGFIEWTQEFIKGEKVGIWFFKHPWLGKVKVSNDGKTLEILGQQEKANASKISHLKIVDDFRLQEEVVEKSSACECYKSCYDKKCSSESCSLMNGKECFGCRKKHCYVFWLD